MRDAEVSGGYSMRKMARRKTDIAAAVRFVQRMIKFREYNDALRQNKGQSKKDCLNTIFRTHKMSV